MLWLVAHLWVGMVVALLLGVLAGWLGWARPLQRAAREREHRGRARAGGR